MVAPVLTSVEGAGMMAAEESNQTRLSGYFDQLLGVADTGPAVEEAIYEQLNDKLQQVSAQIEPEIETYRSLWDNVDSIVDDQRMATVHSLGAGNLASQLSQLLDMIHLVKHLPESKLKTFMLAECEPIIAAVEGFAGYE